MMAFKTLAIALILLVSNLSHANNQPRIEVSLEEVVNNVLINPSLASKIYGGKTLILRVRPKAALPGKIMGSDGKPFSYKLSVQSPIQLLNVHVSLGDSKGKSYIQNTDEALTKKYITVECESFMGMPVNFYKRHAAVSFDICKVI